MFFIQVLVLLNITDTITTKNNNNDVDNKMNKQSNHDRTFQQSIDKAVIKINKENITCNHKSQK